MDKLSPWLSIEMKAEKTAKLRISGHIGVPEDWQHNEAMTDRVVSTKEKMSLELEKISNLKADVIEVEIDSFGGDVNHGLAIYNALAFNPAQVVVSYTSWSASVATVIASAGNVVKAPSNFMGLLHEARGVVMGTTSAMQEAAKNYETINGIAAKIYASKSGKSAKKMRDVMAINGGEGEWKTARELHKLGLIDEVIEPMPAAAYCSDFEEKAKKFGINTNINMGLFNKSAKIASSIKLGDVQAVYDGELSAGVKLVGIGAEVPDGSYELEGKDLVIENSIVKSVTEKDLETFTSVELSAKVEEAVSELQVNLEAKQVELEELQEKYDNLAGLSSTHKPKKKTGVDNEPKAVKPLGLEIKQEIEDLAKKARENFRKKQEGI